MGCDIYTRAERRVNGRWEIIPELKPFDFRHYFMFAFLANERDYWGVPPISQPRGLPDDAPSWEYYDAQNSHSWLSVDELLTFDYDTQFEDRRASKTGMPRMITYRMFLDKEFFDDLAKLKEAGAERVLFGFDG